VGVCRYGPDVPLNSPGPADRGNHYFSGGNSALATASQTVNLSSYSAQIDGGSQGYTLSAWLGGWSSQEDNARVKVEFRNASGSTLGSAEIGPVLAAERNNVSGLVLKSVSGTVPAGARSAVVTMTMTRTAGTANDGYADNLSFVLGAGGGGGGGGGGDGSTGPNVTSLYLEGGSYSTTFAGNGSIWDTEPNGFFAIGVTAPSLNSPFLNGTASRVNLPRGRYWFYLEPGNLGSAVRLTVTYADGSNETAVFSTRDLSIAGAWTRLTGSSNLTLGGTGHTNLNRNSGGESLSPGGAIDFVLEAGLGGAAAGGGGGGTGNLLQNPGAEDGPGVLPGPEGCGGQPNLPGWTGNGSVGVCRYGPDVPLNSPGPADRGNQYFSGGTSAVATASQTVNLASYAATIDAGSQSYTLSGWLGGWSSQNDNARVKVEFKNASGSTLGSAEIGPVLAAERNNVSGLVLKSVSGTLPSGARSAVVTMTMTRVAGDVNNGYADNLSFVLGTGGGSGGGGGGGGDGSIVTPGCNYLIQPLSITGVAGTGGVAVIRITTALNCAWGAGTTANWITFRSATTGSGNGAVEISVAANPSTTSPRSAVVTVAGQQVTVTQNPAPACTYSISPVSVSAPAGGGPGSVTVTATGTGCTWNATSNANWIVVVSTTATTVNYTVQANTSASPRSGTITIAGLTFTVNQAAGGAVPVISAGGVVNAASYAAGANGLARGSFVSIFGNNLGPAQFVQATYPLPTTLGDVRVTFTQGGQSVDAYLVFASATQINAIIPSTAPLGNVNVSVTYRGLTSAPAPVVISDPSLGLFFQRQGERDIGIMQNVYSPSDYPLNTPSQPAERGMVVVAWATGLGSSGRPENTAPGALDMRGRVPVEVRVDGIPAAAIYAGTSPEFAGSNNIYFVVPQEARLGCYIPVEISAGGRQANTVRIAISSSRNTPCTP